MKRISDILKKRGIKPLKYEKKGNVMMVYTNHDKYVFKKSNSEIYAYLLNRNYDYYPETIIEDDYIISRYIDDDKMPDEQKILDLINLVSLLHMKTTYYEKLNINDIKEIFEDTLKNINYLFDYYNILMDNIELNIFMSPKEYALARNVSLIFNNLNICKNDLDKWYENISSNSNYRMVLLHNNLKLEHFIGGKLISWEKSKLGFPIFDLYGLYKETYNLFDWIEIYKQYIKKYPLKKEEVELFIILILMPNKIEFNMSEVEDTIKVSEEIDYLNNSLKFVNQIKEIEVTKK